MPQTTIVIEGISEFIDDLGETARQVKPLLKTAMVQSLNEIKNDAQLMAPFQTGTLRRSLYTELTDNDTTGIVGQDSTIAPYGAAQEFGTVGMTITVPNGRRTKFGRTRPYSYIGNTQPHPYLIPAFEKNLENIVLRFEEAVSNIIKIAGGKA